MLRAYVGALVVIVVPGLLVASILGLRMRELLTWAAIPAFSLATVFLLGEATTLLRVPFGIPAFALLLLILGGVLAFVRWRHWAPPRIPEDAQQDDRASAPIRTRLAQRIEYVLLALGVAIGAFTWFRGLRGIPLVPPGGDATRHGWMVGRILYSQTVEAGAALAYKVGGTHSTWKSYPLALHESAALSTRLVDSDAGRVLVAYVVVFCAVVLPVGMFVLARALAPDRPLVAGFTALVVPLMMLFPYWPVWGGQLPGMVAMTIVPAAVVLLRRTMLARHPPVRLSRALVVALAPSALVLLCIISLHTSELPLIVFLVLLLVLEAAWRRQNVRLLLPALVRGIAIGVFAIALFLPTLVTFAQGVDELRSIGFVPDPASWEPTLGAILQLHFGAGTLPTVRQGFLSLLAVAGAALFLIRRRPAWVAGWIGVVLLTLFASASANDFVYQLTFPWYHRPHRLVQNQAFFVPFFAGITLAFGCMLITRIARRSWVIIPATIATIAVLTVFVGLHSRRANSAFIHASFDPDSPSINQALVSHTSLAAFRWLHDHAARRDTVANEPVFDGSLWMYPLQQVAPLVGPYLPGAPVPSDLADRLYLAGHLQSLGSDPRADRLARRYRTRWVYYETKSLPLGTRVMNLEALQRNPSLTPVFHEGRTWLFRVDLPEPPGATGSQP